MLCCRVQNLLSAFCDSELTGAEMLEIRRHLSDCADCRREHAQVLQMKRLLGGLPAVAPDRPFRLEAVETRARVAPPRSRWARLLLQRLQGFQLELTRLQRCTPFLALGTGVALSGMVIGVLDYPQRPDAVAAHVPRALPGDEDEQGSLESRASEVVLPRALLPATAGGSPADSAGPPSYRYYPAPPVQYYLAPASQRVLVPVAYESRLSGSPQIVNNFSRSGRN